jgi:hypothetical protein
VDGKCDMTADHSCDRCHRGAVWKKTQAATWQLCHITEICKGLSGLVECTAGH